MKCISLTQSMRNLSRKPLWRQQDINSIVVDLEKQFMFMEEVMSKIVKYLTTQRMCGKILSRCHKGWIFHALQWQCMMVHGDTRWTQSTLLSIIHFQFIKPSLMIILEINIIINNNLIYQLFNGEWKHCKAIFCPLYLFSISTLLYLIICWCFCFLCYRH